MKSLHVGGEAMELNQTMVQFVICLNRKKPNPSDPIKLIFSHMQVMALSLAYDFAVVSLERIKRQQEREQEEGGFDDDYGYPDDNSDNPVGHH